MYGEPIQTFPDAGLRVNVDWTVECSLTPFQLRANFSSDDFLPFVVLGMQPYCFALKTQHLVSGFSVSYRRSPGQLFQRFLLNQMEKDFSFLLVLMAKPFVFPSALLRSSDSTQRVSRCHGSIKSDTSPPPAYLVTLTLRRDVCNRFWNALHRISVIFFLFPFSPCTQTSLVQSLFFVNIPRSGTFFTFSLSGSRRESKCIMHQPAP